MTRAERKRLFEGLIEVTNAVLETVRRSELDDTERAAANKAVLEFAHFEAVRLAQCAKCLVEQFKVVVRDDDGTERTIDLMKRAAK